LRDQPFNISNLGINGKFLAAFPDDEKQLYYYEFEKRLIIVELNIEKRIPCNH